MLPLSTSKDKPLRKGKKGRNKTDEQLELLNYGYIRSQFSKMNIDKIFPIDIYEIINAYNGKYERFNSENYTKSKKKNFIFSDNDCCISQKDHITRSCLGTFVIEKDDGSFQWEFEITEWNGYCCRVGVISSETIANGSI